MTPLCNNFTEPRTANRVCYVSRGLGPSFDFRNWNSRALIGSSNFDLRSDWFIFPRVEISWLCVFWKFILLQTFKETRWVPFSFLNLNLIYVSGNMQNLFRNHVLFTEWKKKALTSRYCTFSEGRWIIYPKILHFRVKRPWLNLN